LSCQQKESEKLSGSLASAESKLKEKNEQAVKGQLLDTQRGERGESAGG
jgi:hypothetical protein